MVSEAQKMMQDPAFQAKMKMLMQNPAYQEAMRRSQEMMKDPKKVEALQKQIEKSVKEGKSPVDAAKTFIQQSEEGDNTNDSNEEDEIEDVPEIEAVPIVGGAPTKKKTNKKKKKTNKKK